MLSNRAVVEEFRLRYNKFLILRQFISDSDSKLLKFMYDNNIVNDEDVHYFKYWIDYE